MKSMRLAFVIFALCILLIITVAFATTVRASPSPASFNVQVDHIVQIQRSGLMVINDTITLEPDSNTQPLSNYTLGIPFGAQLNLDYVFAYETSNPATKLKVDLDVGIGRIGFYGINVVFPQAIDLNTRGSYGFTVVFVFSDNVSVNTVSVEGEQLTFYNASFPAFPALTQATSNASLTVVFPVGLNYTSSSFENEGIIFTRTVKGSAQYFNATEISFPEFLNQTGWFETTPVQSSLELFDVTEIQRQIELTSNEEMTVSDAYRIVGRGGNLSKAAVNLPNEAFNIQAIDELGLVPADRFKTTQGSTSTNVTITFRLTYSAGSVVQFSLQYQLPWKNHVSASSLNDFVVSFPLFGNFNWTIRKLTTTVLLPEGATLQSSTPSPALNSYEDSAFSSSLTFVFQNATPFHDLTSTFSYQRLFLWDSFRPTLWIGSLVILAAILVGAFRFYRPPSAPLSTAIVGVHAEDLKAFVDAYEERIHLMQETASLETQARKGKIPRRLYKVRKMTFESRLTSLSRELTALREKIRMAGPRYADLMRQIEVAETELRGAEADVTRAEVEYRRGELSAAAYHTSLETSYRRRDRAQTTIDGVLLRLREEIS